MFDMEGDVALVTGSSSGLGKGSAKALAEQGVNVVMNGRNQERLDEAVDEVGKHGSADVVGYAGDLTVPEDLEGMVETTVDEFGGLDHLVTSAGGPPSGPFLEMSDGEWYDTFDMLVMSVVRLIRESAEHLRESDAGSVVNITSMTVKEASESLVLSNSVRMSVIGLEKTLSRELAPDVRVNAVLPGSIETARTTELIQQAISRGEYEQYEDGLADRAQDVPLDRLGEPRELGDVVAFLCSPHASYVNGVAIPIDGGSSRSNL
jgi:NAD(P)-dependent dehydrogenase (short-subunit alcohol dehydrogenase family)